MFIIHCPIRVRSFRNTARCKPGIFDEPFLDYFGFVNVFFSYEKLISRATPCDGVQIFFLKHSHTELSKHELNQNKTGRDRDTVNISKTEARQLQVEAMSRHLVMRRLEIMCIASNITANTEHSINT